MLVSADAVKDRAAVVQYRSSLGVTFPTYLKTGDDMEFINGIDPAWLDRVSHTLLINCRRAIIELGWRRRYTAREALAATIA